MTMIHFLVRFWQALSMLQLPAAGLSNQLSVLWLPDYGHTSQLADKRNPRPAMIDQTPEASSEMNSYMQAEMAVCSVGSAIQGMRGVSPCQVIPIRSAAQSKFCSRNPMQPLGEF
jgi:hypothetical protein